jgi:hypothetical protein
MSVNCKICGASAGCSCQLSNGMCAACAAKAKETQK